MDVTPYLWVTSDRHILSMPGSTNGGETWLKVNSPMEISGYRCRLVCGFFRLRPTPFAVVRRKVIMRNLTCRALAPCHQSH